MLVTLHDLTGPDFILRQYRADMQDLEDLAMLENIVAKLPKDNRAADGR